jgi:soluble lytic murein transglycosylase-like protein
MGPGAGGTGPTPTAGNVVPVNAYEAALYRQAGNLSTWAQQNRKWCAAIIKVESNGNPVAVSSKGAIGIMQVLPGTAQQMFNGGYTHFQPTAAVLATEAGGIYFGTAYLEYLASIHPDREWVAKAYYGGPGWEGMGAAYKASCETYLTQVKAAYVAIYGGLSA